MRYFLAKALVLLLFLWVESSKAQIFPFLTCSGPECKFCLAGSARGSNKVCSKAYSTNPGANDPTPGFSNISRELTDDLTNKLVKLKEFPKEGFEVKDFYKKYAEYSCERGEQELAWIDKQIKYLQWKKKKIEESRASKSCKPTQESNNKKDPPK